MFPDTHDRTYIRSLLAAAATVLCLEPDARADQLTDGAYALVAGRVDGVNGSFYVYRNADSGQNHGYPSGLFGSGTGFTSAIALDPAYLDGPAGSLDRARGTVFSVTFSPQAQGQYAGLNMEEPQDWGAGGQPASNGYNLTGAANLVFEARTPTPGGVWLEFGAAGGTVAPVWIPQADTYVTETIPLSGLSASSTSAIDFSDVHLLFTVGCAGTYNANGGTVYLDNIRYEPVPASQSGTLGFPLATQTFGVTPSGTGPFPPDQVLRNVTSIYESSMAVILLLARGQQKDLAQARLIADTFDYALQHDNHGDPLPAAADGSTGLHNGYSSGAIALFNAQVPPEGGLAGDVRIAGFTCSTSVTPSGYAAVLDGATGGNNAFAILALAAAYRQFGDNRYLNDARTLGDWITGNLLDPSGTGYGGYFVGYPDQGVPPPKPLNRGKSTENNADIFAAFTVLAQIDPANAAAWTARADSAGDFVMRMYDPSQGRFYAGTAPVGTPANLPQGSDPAPATALGNDVINAFDFLDTDTFTTLALAAAPRYRNQIDWHKPVQHALATFAKTGVATGSGTFSGFSLVQAPVSGADGIAWEFTGQMVETMRFVEQLYGDTDFGGGISTGLGQIQNAQQFAPFGDGQGLVAATVQAGDQLPPLDQTLNTPYQNIPERVGLAATIWAAFADSGLNVFEPLAPAVLTLSGPSTVRAGGQAIFSVTASGSILSYQWNLAGSAVAGATSSSLVLDPVTAACSGSYTVTITGPGGSVTSAGAVLAVQAAGAPVISGQPQAQTMAVGSTAVIGVSASQADAGAGLFYQWYLNGVALAGATQPTLLLSGVSAADEGSYVCLVSNSSGSALSSAATLAVTATADPGRLTNLSCRAAVGTGSGVLIAGLVVGGAGTSGAEPLLIRAAGPALSSFGVAGILPDPQLTFTGPAGPIAANDGWGGAAAVANTAAAVGAFGWVNPTSHDAALLEAPTAGSYTAAVSGASGDGGVALVEAYDVSSPEGDYTPETPRLINISTRVEVGTAGGVGIVGFEIGGLTSETVLIRASGPALIPFGVAGILPDPQLQLDGAGGLLAQNTGWGGNALIASAASLVGAFSWGAAETPDSALLVTLPPGAYTAVVSGAGADSGISLIEVYEVP